MGDDRIRLATSIPSLKNKIKTNIDPDSPIDVIYWYIKFNIPLDESSVSDKTMSVTDAEGYIMRTFISYDVTRNLIVITPLDSYEQNIYYLLNISKKVKSLKGKHLRSKIHILFKLIGNQISEYKVLRSNAIVPKPKPRPRNYEQRFTSGSKLYSFDKAILDKVPQYKLPTAPLRVNLVLPLVALVLTVAAVYIKSAPLIAASIAICLGAAGYMLYQLSQPTARSVLYYNRGVRQFNKAKYKNADINIRKAIEVDQMNELAEYAIDKIEYYLEK